MENYVEREWHRNRDAEYINKLKENDNERCFQFFYGEIGGILRRIQVELFQGDVELDEMVNELYLYLSQNNWAKLDSFDGRNGCQLRTWIIPVAWRFFFSRRRMFRGFHLEEERPRHEYDRIDDDLRIQIAIDVNAVLAKMPNKKYLETLKLLIIEGYKASDVAEMMGMRIENIYNLKHRAIKQFIELYGN